MMKIQSLLILFTLFLWGTMSTSLSGQACDCPAESNQLTNPDFNLGNTGFSSELLYTDGCGQGEYYIGHEGRDKCPNSTWIDDNWDNTVGTSAGNYMIVDGPSNEDDFPLNIIWRSGASIVNGTNYSFSFAVLPKISGSSTNNLTLACFVNDINISGDIVLPNVDHWSEYCFNWTANYSGFGLVQIRQVNNFSAGGFDYGLDDIYFGDCQEEPVICETDASWNWELDLPSCAMEFTNTSTAGEGTTIVGYIWEFGDGTTSNESSPTQYYAAGGWYEVCLTVYSVTDEGDCCTDTYCKTIPVHCNPSACKAVVNNIYYSIFEGDGCTVQLSASVDANRPIIGYYWNFGDGSTGVGDHPVHEYASGSTYEVCVTVVLQDGNKCCTATLCKKIKVTCHHTSAKTANEDHGHQFDQEAPAFKATASALKISPNPSDEVAVLEFSSLGAQDYQLNILDLQGKVVNMAVGQAERGTNNYSIDTQALPAGTYFINLWMNQKMYTEKLIVY